MGKYSGILLCSDFDGTLCYHHTISDENCAAIRHFQENGGLFTLATGRYPTIIKEYPNFFTPNAAMICLNGAIVYDDQHDHLLQTELMPKGFEAILPDLLHDFPAIRNLSLFPANPWKCTMLTPNQLDEGLQMMKQPLCKITFHFDPTESDKIKNALLSRVSADFGITRSWNGGIEVQGATYDKGIAAVNLSQMVHADCLVCVGDYENDITMLQKADIGFAVANAIPATKEAADRVTSSDATCAIAEIIESL